MLTDLEAAVTELRRMKSDVESSLGGEYATGYLVAMEHAIGVIERSRDAGGCTNPTCPLERAHAGPCAPSGWNTRDTDEREAVRVAVGGVLFNAMNFPERVITRLLGQDMGPLTEKVTDAVLAAGVRPRVKITDGQRDAATRAVEKVPYTAWLNVTRAGAREIADAAIEAVEASR